MKSFFRKHQELVTFLSAAIVFGTFIVNEIFRDRYKDLADSVSSAQTSFLIRSQYSDFPVQLNNAEESIKGAVNFLGERMGFLRSDYEVAARDGSNGLWAYYSGRLEQRADRLDIRIGSLNALAGILPEKIKDRKDIDALNQKLIKTRKSMSDGLGYVVDSQDTEEKKMSTADEILRTSKNELDEVSDAIRPIEDGLLEQAKQLVERNERYYAVSRWASYLLYVVGWTLGLMARVWGSDNVPAGE